MLTHVHKSEMAQSRLDPHTHVAFSQHFFVTSEIFSGKNQEKRRFSHIEIRDESSFDKDVGCPRLNFSTGGNPAGSTPRKAMSSAYVMSVHNTS